MAATTITRATITDDSGNGTSGTILNSAWFGTAIYDKIDALFTASQRIEASSAGAILEYAISNTSTAASSAARLGLFSGGSAAGDAYAVFGVSGVDNWAIGLDNSDSDTFKICNSATLGTNDILNITTGTNIGVNGQSFGGGAGVVFLKNCTVVPTTNPSTGGVFYTESGALKYRGSSGTVTTLGAA